MTIVCVIDKIVVRVNKDGMQCWQSTCEIFSKSGGKVQTGGWRHAYHVWWTSPRKDVGVVKI